MKNDRKTYTKPLLLRREKIAAIVAGSGGFPVPVLPGILNLRDE